LSRQLRYRNRDTNLTQALPLSRIIFRIIFKGIYVMDDQYSDLIKGLTIEGGTREKTGNTPATPLDDAHPGGYFYARSSARHPVCNHFMGFPPDWRQDTFWRLS